MCKDTVCSAMWHISWTALDSKSKMTETLKSSNGAVNPIISNDNTTISIGIDKDVSNLDFRTPRGFLSYYQILNL